MNLDIEKPEIHYQVAAANACHRAGFTLAALADNPNVLAEILDCVEGEARVILGCKTRGFLGEPQNRTPTHQRFWNRIRLLRLAGRQFDTGGVEPWPAKRQPSPLLPTR